jgi:hypothetical protein
MCRQEEAWTPEEKIFEWVRNEYTWFILVTLLNWRAEEAWL